MFIKDKELLNRIRSIDRQIERDEFISKDTIAKLKQERFLVEALDFCEDDKERAIVENLGPEFIAHHFDELEKFVDCSCRGMDYSFGLKAFRFIVFREAGTPFKCEDRSRDDEHDAGHWFLLTSGRRAKRDCFYRHGLIRAYCLVKNDPSLLTRIREELKQKEAVK